MTFDLSKYTTRTAQDFENPFYLYGNRFVQVVSKFYMKVIAKTKIYGLEHIPKTHSNFILASNHASNLDPFLVGSNLPNINTAFLAKKELLEDIRTRFLMELSGVIAIDREKVGISSIRSCKVALQSKHWCLGIFPEGTRQKSESDTNKGKSGVAFFAKATKSSILPAAIHMFGPRKQNITIVYGPLIPYEGQNLEAFTELVMNAIATLKKEAEEHAKKDF